LPIKNWLVLLLAVLAKRLKDKGPQFVGAHVLKVRKLARLISLRPLRRLPESTPVSLIALIAALYGLAS
jgi:hypothetical protein